MGRRDLDSPGRDRRGATRQWRDRLETRGQTRRWRWRGARAALLNTSTIMAQWPMMRSARRSALVARLLPSLATLLPLMWREATTGKKHIHHADTDNISIRAKHGTSR